MAGVGEPGSGLPLSYEVPAGRATAELLIRRSTFIAAVGPAADVATAQAFVAEIKAIYPDASHHASAYRLGGGPQAAIGSSDDGEPGGTAGRPMLAVLEGSGLQQVVAVVTRYFGGIKLGSGGLVRAYGGAVREALRTLPRRTFQLHHLADITCDYALYGKLKYLLPQRRVRILAEAFAADISLQMAVPHPELDTLDDLLRELSNGKIRLAPRATQYLSNDD